MVLIRFVNSNYNTKGYVFIISIAINEERNDNNNNRRRRRKNFVTELQV